LNRHADGPYNPAYTMPTIRIISIGSLSAHPLWGEKQPVRSGHATTTLIISNKAIILVDPGLPEQAIVARLAERANLRPSDITHVFLTTFHPDTHRGITAFEKAHWLIDEKEREGAGVPLVNLLKEASARENQAGVEALTHEIAILQRCQPAPDSLAPDVDLFPLPGVTPGSCGLLVSETELTTLICGDALPTCEHIAHSMVMPMCHNLEGAKASFNEALSIADMLIPGRDNIMANPTETREVD